MKLMNWMSRRPGLRWAILMLAMAAAGARAGVVTDWNATTQGILVAKGATPGVYYALVHVAIYDAVNAIDGRYSVFAVKPTSDPRGASKDAAAASAAYNTLLGLYPDQAATLQAAYATSLSAIPDGSTKTRGIAVGAEVASAWLAARANDGREAVVPYVFGTQPGDYQRTPPAFPNPITPWVAKMTPFTLTSPSQFRAYGPPDLTSARYARDLNAVKSLGARESTERSAEETEIAMFHTENPTTFWARNLRDLAASKSLDTADSARLFAMAFVGFGDAAIACWDSKFYFNRWRPVTAIAGADGDGNDATVADPAWLPLANTPPHPEYPAAHGCVSAEITDTLRRFFGTRYLDITLTSTVPGSIPHVFHCTDDIIEEVKMARVWGGMHFPTSVVHGARIGHEVADWIGDHYFQRIKRRR